MWEELAKKNTTRASLFNLIVFNFLSARTDYFRQIVDTVTKRFPCRSFFISENTESTDSYLKTVVSITTFHSEETSSIACDQIDIQVAGVHLQQIPFILLPHLLPDLPTYLIWAPDPSVTHPLFSSLSKIATRIIFDSESTNDLVLFATTVLDLYMRFYSTVSDKIFKERVQIDIADLNWARTAGWRELLASTFNTSDLVAILEKTSEITIIYNGNETPFFCHLQTQALYVLAWLASRFNWKLKKNGSSTLFQFESIKVFIVLEKWTQIGSGTLIGMQLQTNDGYSFKAKRMPDQYHHVKVETSSLEKCELPYHFILERAATGQSLTKEICTKGTSTHYLEMLKILTVITA